MTKLQEIDEPITLTAYDIRWPLLFKDEKLQLQGIFRKSHIEHFGSTSIPNLKAKPIIDILIGLSAPITESHLKQLTGLGYKGYGEAGVPGRLYFIKRLPTTSYNLAITPYNSSIWKNNIALRNYLRCHPEEAKEYAQIKESIITKNKGITLLEYSKQKNTFIQILLDKALLWAKKEPMAKTHKRLPRRS
jgi:GrpB-like predicted nucleotidyltransferase (UPF0157 family)